MDLDEFLMCQCRSEALVLILEQINDLLNDGRVQPVVARLAPALTYQPFLKWLTKIGHENGQK
jgi:hypothetical protein